MSRYPFRVKSLRTLQSVRADGEKDSIREESHRVCLWRMNDHEFYVERVIPSTEQPMASVRPKAGIACVIPYAMVRDVELYSPGDPLPWPEHTSPPAVIDSAEAMLAVLTAPAAAKPKQAKQGALGV